VAIITKKNNKLLKGLENPGEFQNWVRSGKDKKTERILVKLGWLATMELTTDTESWLGARTNTFLLYLNFSSFEGWG